MKNGGRRGQHLGHGKDREEGCSNSMEEMQHEMSSHFDILLLSLPSLVLLTVFLRVQ
jgi:hypothetical protein